MLRISNLCITYSTDNRSKTAVQNMQMIIEQGDFVGLVGESGSGKTSIANAVLDVLPANATLDGQIEFTSKAGPSDSVQDLRKRQVSYIGQNFFKMLSQYFTVGNHYRYLFRSLYHRSPRRDDFERFFRILEQMNLDNPEKLMKSYPFELSGGMVQRVVIALSLVKNPKLLIADEPTSAIDQVAKQEFIRVLKRLSSENNMSVLLISHDLNLIFDFCSKIYVIFRGQLAEFGTSKIMRNTPLHPYTQLLLKPQDYQHDIDASKQTDETDRCVFFPICNRAVKDCMATPRTLGVGHVVFCSEVDHARD